MRRRIYLVVFALLTATTCGSDRVPIDADLDPILAAMSAERIERDVRALAADEMEGRGTATGGHALAADYVRRRFEELELRPAGDDGTWFQAVPLVHAEARLEASRLAVVHEGRTTVLAPGRDWLLAPDFTREAAEVHTGAVYAGFGVTAPEAGYDDYADLDVRGKVVVVFRGAPATLSGDLRAFHGSGRRKRTNAIDHGAVGIVTVATPGDRRRTPWSVAVARAQLGAMRWVGADGRPRDAHEELFLDAELSESGVQTLFEGAPEPLDTIVARADEGRPGGFALPVEIQATTSSSQRRLTSPNVVAKLPAAKASLADEELVVLTAHLDHLGSGEGDDGDRIYNGAYDNAAGVAVLLEVAHAFRELPEPPARRSILFIATTGEERGLLGADYFAHHPPTEPEAIVAALNFDMALMLHPLSRVVGFGAEHSSLNEPLTQAAAQLGLEVAPDPFPEQAIFVRSDHYAFVRQGVPALYIATGFGDDGGAAEREWLQRMYHTPGDDLEQPFDFDAGADFARLAFLTAWHVAVADRAPSWNPGDPFGDRFGRGR